MIALLACAGHTAVDSLLFGGPIVGVIGWIKFDSWRRRNDPDPDLDGDALTGREPAGGRAACMDPRRGRRVGFTVPQI
jgi:hypothetical protein